MGASFCMDVMPSADKLSRCLLPQRVRSTVLQERLPAGRPAGARPRRSTSSSSSSATTARILFGLSATCSQDANLSIYSQPLFQAQDRSSAISRPKEAMRALHTQHNTLREKHRQLPPRRAPSQIYNTAAVLVVLVVYIPLW